jgi:glycosyltransferase involved in cell wall biosynthesis
VYIYNGIDVDHFAEPVEFADAADDKRMQAIGKEDIVLGNVAGFREEKKQEDLVRAAKELRDSGYPIKVLLVGSGPRQRIVERHIESYDMREHVILTGLQKDVRPYLKQMDCFILSSHQETFSLAALEAMAAGKPLIMTDVGGAGEMVENGVNGFLFTPGDVGQLVDKIKNLIDHNLFEAMGTNSRKIVGERFTLKQMVYEYERVL